MKGQSSNMFMNVLGMILRIIVDGYETKHVEKKMAEQSISYLKQYLMWPDFFVFLPFYLLMQTTRPKTELINVQGI